MPTSWPLVSIIISAYNHEKYIEHTVNSLINQTYQNLELIIIDDGSTDLTWQKICNLEEICNKRFCRVVFSTHKNAGICETTNKLIELCQGKYIYMIASDDIAKPFAIEKEVNFLENNPDYALVVGDNEIIDSEGKVCFWDKNRNIVYNKKQAKFITFADQLKKNRNFDFTSSKFGSYSTLYVGNYIPNGYLVRSSIFSIIEPFTDEAPLSDLYMMLQIAKYSKMKYLDEILFSYRWHATNTIKDKVNANLITEKTKQYEEEILNRIDLSKVNPEVIEVKNNGVCYKKKGIPYIFQVLTTMKKGKKTKIFKLFNVKLYESR